MTQLERRWADLVDLALIISRVIQHQCHSDPRAALPTQTEGVVMCHLLRGGPAAPSQIAAATGLLRPNVSAALRTLQSKGLIEKQADSTDGRGFTVRTTTLGHANGELVRHEWARAAAEAADHDTTDLDAALALLAKVKDGLRPARRRPRHPG